MDISDLKRWYDSSEIKKLNEPQAGRRVLLKIMGDKRHHQRHKDKIDKIKASKRRRVKSVTTSKPDGDSSVLSEQDKLVVAAVITGMNNSSRHSSSMNGRVIKTKMNSVSTLKSAQDIERVQEVEEALDKKWDMVGRIRSHHSNSLHHSFKTL